MDADAVDLGGRVGSEHDVTLPGVGTIVRLECAALDGGAARFAALGVPMRELARDSRRVLVSRR